jgi:hypothetical protein
LCADEGLFNPLSEDISWLVSDIPDEYLGVRLVTYLWQVLKAK